MRPPGVPHPCPLVIGALLVAAFIGWELRAREPMLPLHLFRGRGFTVTNLASLLMFFGMFGKKGETGGQGQGALARQGVRASGFLTGPPRVM